ncbi:peroxiredoxin Q/BCP [Crenobacter luteus]|uniref:thioredoxin-dependent peroxiredoxin n=1 Tax=Crenobacter luteus TaxID=1452487 RepID=A0A163CC74_9NEIS|nr:peroxiredoxin [Crenobacter luteus]KZE31252.1 alkyl hydroperoxide reductase [Crenobacter luteus]TCP11614.1 peroxiredoxin Q/BCP [Crenobacter luteus]
MEGQRCPDFTLPATSGKTFVLEEAGKPLVIYFYPKDNTPGCTNESMAFRDLYADFKAAGADIVGVSRDGLKSHENFKAKLELPFELLSDGDETVCTLFDVMKMKNLYGKQVRGVERSTFVVAADGTIARAWRGVKVPGHAEEVLAFVKTL